MTITIDLAKYTTWYLTALGITLTSLALTSLLALIYVGTVLLHHILGWPQIH